MLIGGVFWVRCVSLIFFACACAFVCMFVCVCVCVLCQRLCVLCQRLCILWHLEQLDGCVQHRNTVRWVRAPDSTLLKTRSLLPPVPLSFFLVFGPPPTHTFPHGNHTVYPEEDPKELHRNPGFSAKYMQTMNEVDHLLWQWAIEDTVSHRYARHGYNNASVLLFITAIPIISVRNVCATTSS